MTNTENTNITTINIVTFVIEKDIITTLVFRLNSFSPHV
jgi:hypothetical protein